MTQIIEIIKVNEDKENITFTFTVQKDMVDGFIKVLHGFHEATQHICYKMRNSEEKQRAAREARDREVKRQFDMIKEHIRKAYYKHYEATDDVRQSFKLTRLEYMAHNHLVARVRKEFAYPAHKFPPISLDRFHHPAVMFPPISE